MSADRPHDVIPGSGQVGQSKVLPHVVSIRFEAPLLRECRELSDADGVTLSTWVRDAAMREVRRRHPEWIYGWRCKHLEITGPQGTISGPSCSYGCNLEPIYDPPPRSGIGWPS